MVNPPAVSEIDFTFKCKIATYDEHKITDLHTYFSDNIKQRMKDLVGQQGVVSYAETTMEK